MHSADVPVPKLHTGTGQAYVRWNGQMKYFGRFGTDEADKKYWIWRGSIGIGNAGGCTVRELINRYAISRTWERAQLSRFRNIRDALQKLDGLPANNYGPAVFKAHRSQIAATGTRSARQCNDLMRLVQRIFKWGVSESLVQYDVWAALKTVEPLKPYDVARQPKPREAAIAADVLAAMEHMKDTVWVIVRLLMLTGARPGEIVGMRKSWIDTNGPKGMWVYRPKEHKTAHRGKKRFIIFNQECKEIIGLVLTKADSSDWLFPSKILNSHYTETALRQAVGHACKAAGVPHWTPYQLRHMRLTNIAQEHGIDAAVAVAGHGDVSTTNIYLHEPDAESIRKAG